MSRTAQPIRAIVGLGNPGAQYEQTLHNAGFWFVDRLARRYGGQFRAEASPTVMCGCSSRPPS